MQYADRISVRRIEKRKQNGTHFRTEEIMDTSLSWIKAYVPDLDCTAQEYTDAMTLSGTKVEGSLLERSIRLRNILMQINL